MNAGTAGKCKIRDVVLNPPLLIYLVEVGMEILIYCRNIKRKRPRGSKEVFDETYDAF